MTRSQQESTMHDAVFYIDLAALFAAILNVSLSIHNRNWDGAIGWGVAGIGFCRLLSA
jgi:hypothetical protein